MKFFYCGIRDQWLAVSLRPPPQGATPRRVRDHRQESKASLFIAVVGGDENDGGETQEALPETRRKQRHRCARGPLWRGRGSTERGAPTLEKDYGSPNVPFIRFFSSSVRTESVTVPLFSLTIPIAFRHRVSSRAESANSCPAQVKFLSIASGPVLVW
jgi:hypothetical protein